MLRVGTAFLVCAVFGASSDDVRVESELHDLDEMDMLDISAADKSQEVEGNSFLAHSESGASKKQKRKKVNPADSHINVHEERWEPLDEKRSELKSHVASFDELLSKLRESGTGAMQAAGDFVANKKRLMDIRDSVKQGVVKSRNELNAWDKVTKEQIVALAADKDANSDEATGLTGLVQRRDGPRDGADDEDDGTVKRGASYVDQIAYQNGSVDLGLRPSGIASSEDSHSAALETTQEEPSNGITFIDDIEA